LPPEVIGAVEVERKNLSDRLDGLLDSETCLTAADYRFSYHLVRSPGFPVRVQQSLHLVLFLEAVKRLLPLVKFISARDHLL
jgi:hypothetical protein